MIARLVFLLMFSFASASSAFAQSYSEKTMVQQSGNWESFRLCGNDGNCIWRATTTATNTDDLLMLEWSESENLGMPQALMLSRISYESMSTWDTNIDHVATQLRVDLNPIKTTSVPRYLDRDSRVLIALVPQEIVNRSFVRQLKQGNMLRYRTEVNGFKHTRLFSLRGAAKAITRAEELSKAAYKLRNDNYDPYFDDPSFGGVNNSHRSSRYGEASF